MSREIKFKRAFFKDEAKTQFRHFDTWGVGIDGSMFKSPSSNSSAHHFEDLQYTGLKDKNGKEIFEGDVLIWRVNDIERTAPVYFDELQASFWMGKDINSSMLVLNDWMRGEYEILGNIYQRPELTK